MTILSTQLSNADYDEAFVFAYHQRCVSIANNNVVTVVFLLYRDDVWLLTDDAQVHMLDDGSYYFEIDGIPEYDVDDDDSLPDIETKKQSRVQFSKAPIRVRAAYANCM